jgi:Flp pilus assembly protein TadG
MTRLQSASKKRERGNALLEFALGFGVLWLLFSGVWEFGYTFFVYNRLLTSVADAGIYASRLDYDVSVTEPASFNTLVQNMVLCSDPNNGSCTQNVARGLTAANVSVDLHLDNAYPTYVTISIKNYTITNLFGYFQLPSKPSVTTMYEGRIICSGC